jgi:hypothetical protein
MKKHTQPKGEDMVVLLERQAFTDTLDFKVYEQYASLQLIDECVDIKVKATDIPYVSIPGYGRNILPVTCDTFVWKVMKKGEGVWWSYAPNLQVGVNYQTGRLEQVHDNLDMITQSLAITINEGDTLSLEIMRTHDEVKAFLLNLDTGEEVMHYFKVERLWGYYYNLDLYFKDDSEEHIRMQYMTFDAYSLPKDARVCVHARDWESQDLTYEGWKEHHTILAQTREVTVYQANADKADDTVAKADGNPHGN